MLGLVDRHKFLWLDNNALTSIDYHIRLQTSHAHTSISTCALNEIIFILRLLLLLLLLLQLILGNDGDEDHFSDETIYEDIDELVQQFDLTMKSTMQAMQQMSPKKTKKKKREFFGGSIGKSSGMKIMEEKRTQLEYGEQHRGYLHKRSGGGSWKKKYCVLKGCIFSYSK